jgi:hypothetical protein
MRDEGDGPLSRAEIARIREEASRARAEGWLRPPPVAPRPSVVAVKPNWGAARRNRPAIRLFATQSRPGARPWLRPTRSAAML